MQMFRWEFTPIPPRPAPLTTYLDAALLIDLYSSVDQTRGGFGAQRAHDAAIPGSGPARRPTDTTDLCLQLALPRCSKKTECVQCGPASGAAEKSRVGGEYVRWPRNRYAFMVGEAVSHSSCSGSCARRFMGMHCGRRASCPPFRA